MQTFRVVTLALAVALPWVAEAEFAQPVPAPVDRLIANIDRQLIGQPKDGDLNYRRGRLYALKSVQREVHVFGDVESNFKVMSRNSAVLEAPATAEARAALETSIAAYRLALKARPDEPLFHLGLAWALEAGAKAGVEKVTAKDARAEYRRAFELSREQDSKLTRKPLSIQGLDSLVSHEAGEAYVRTSASSGEDPVFLKAVQEHVAKLKGLPRGSVTPIIYSRTGKRSLAQLEDPAHCSTFDLDGTGRGACWRWLTPDAGILVWDPSGKGHVENGWQLFGSVSFFLFFQHGYEALALLDDDGNGWLEGKELPGLAVWTDQNRDGLPQPSEVKSVQAEGIGRIAVRGVQRADGLWQQPRGLEFTDGSTRATWDWISKPQSVSPATPGARP